MRGLSGSTSREMPYFREGFHRSRAGRRSDVAGRDSGRRSDVSHEKNDEQPTGTICDHRDPRPLVWPWMKCVIGANDAHHCTNVLRGRYSKKSSKNNPDFAPGVPVACDEQPAGSFTALYVCGVAAQGYRAPLPPDPWAPRHWALRGRRKQNYPHNLHLPIRPAPGHTSEFTFEDWRVTIESGVVLPIPTEAELPERYRSFAPQFTACRIFRWAVTCPSLAVTAFGSS